MIGFSTITQKGQVTIPADIRRELGLFPRQKVVIIKDADGARINSIPDFFSLFGSVKPVKKPEDFKAMRKAFVKYISSRKKL